MTLTAAHNWGLTESCIDKNWKLENWNEKKWKFESQFYIFAIFKLQYDVFYSTLFPNRILLLVACEVTRQTIFNTIRESTFFLL